jgi:hypothetical protein
VPEQQVALAVQGWPAGRQQVPVPPQVAPFVLQQSNESRHAAPGGPHAQVPLLQSPLQQSVPVAQMPPVRAQQWPPWQAAPAQQSIAMAQVPLSGTQQLAPAQLNPGQQSAFVAQNSRAAEQHMPVEAAQVYGAQQGAVAPQAPFVKPQHRPPLQVPSQHCDESAQVAPAA